MRRLALTAAVGVAVLVLVPSTGIARERKAPRPRIYIEGCDPALVVKPATLCFAYGSDALAPPPETRAENLTYRHYGSPVADAFGQLQVCVGAHSQVLDFCEERKPSFHELAPMQVRAAFRFFYVVRCNGGGLPGSRLYYGKFSFSFAGRPWETRWHLPNFFGPERPRCYEVHRSALSPVRAKRAFVFVKQ